MPIIPFEKHEQSLTHRSNITVGDHTIEIVADNETLAHLAGFDSRAGLSVLQEKAHQVLEIFKLLQLDVHTCARITLSQRISEKSTELFRADNPVLNPFKRGRVPIVYCCWACWEDSLKQQSICVWY